jgi:hypothetical protein
MTKHTVSSGILFIYLFSALLAGVIGNTFATDFNASKDLNSDIKKQKQAPTTASVDLIEKSIDYQKLMQVGSATLTFLFWDVYRSSLYTSTGDYPLDNNQQVLVLKIDYLRDIDKAELIEQTIAQWQHLGLKEEDFNQFVPRLAEIWPDITAGDSLALLVNDKMGHFYLNNLSIGGIEDNNFSKIFIDIWLSKKTSQPRLRKQLIGKTK